MIQHLEVAYQIISSSQLCFIFIKVNLRALCNTTNQFKNFDYQHGNIMVKRLSFCILYGKSIEKHS